MALSIFEDKSVMPDEHMLEEALQASYKWWKEIRFFVYRLYPEATEEWKYSGKNYGWGFRLKDTKRVIVYLTPADGFFRFSIVFGEKATQQALQNNISKNIIKIIQEAKVYAEGRGIRIEVKNAELLSDIKEMISIKIQN